MFFSFIFLLNRVIAINFSTERKNPSRTIFIVRDIDTFIIIKQFTPLKNEKCIFEYAYYTRITPVWNIKV